ncbi:DUF835 domain-containing protein [Thermococcus barophilus]|nr:DUF835 domain-containing protein [Thermococcus barophilus]
MDKMFLNMGRGLSLVIKLIAALYLLYIARTRDRKSALIWGLAWLSAALSILFDIAGVNYLNSLFEALFASLLFCGVLMIINEEAFYFFTPGFYYVASVPFIITLYLIGIMHFGERSEWMMTIGVPYGLSGFYILLSGVLILPFSRVYRKKATFLAISLILYGAHEMDYPILRPVSWFAPIGFLLGAIFTFMVSYSVIQFVRTERFQEFPRRRKYEKSEGEIETGVLIIGEEKYREIRETLQNTKVLAFLRDLSNVPGRWEVYFITHITGKDFKTISPTNLAKMVELVNRYLRSMAETEQRGIIVIDCLEYLIMYNSFESIVKFLSLLRDFVLMYGGTLVLVTNPSVWSEKEWALLKRLLS